MAKTNPSMALAFEDEDERELVPFERPARTPRAPRPPRPTAEGGSPMPRRRAPLGSERRTPWRFLLGTRVGRVLLGAGALAAAAGVWISYREVRGFLLTDPHFLLASPGALDVTGTSQLPESELGAVFGQDLGRNIFLVPLKTRQAQLEQSPWVAHATVMRLLPDHLRVAVTERTPVAFARLGNSLELVDGEGVILHLAPSALAARHYSFPVVTGLAATDPAPSRAERMHLYSRLMAELGAGGVTGQLSEINLADTENVRVSVPAEGHDLLLDLGDSGFLQRFRAFQAHLPEWREQYPQLAEADLRYDRQVVLKMTDGAIAGTDATVARGGSLMPAPEPAAAPARHTAASHLPPTAHRKPAGHGTAHGWRPV